MAFNNTCIKIYSKTVAELKMRFPMLQNALRNVLSNEMEKVVREEKFLKDEPDRLETALRRCKKLTGTLVTLKRYTLTLISIALAIGEHFMLIVFVLSKNSSLLPVDWLVFKNNVYQAHAKILVWRKCHDPLTISQRIR